MTECSFCKQNYEIPMGMTIVQKDGTPRFFCSSKCRKNWERRSHLKKKRRVKWVDKLPNSDYKKRMANSKK
jgi:ribosomal protein L24E